MSKKGKVKNFKKIEKQSSSENDEIMRMIKVLGGVVLALAAFYFIFAIYNGEISFGGDEEETVPAEIQNVEIMAGSTFNRMEEEYYVLMYDFEGDYAGKYGAIYELYTQKSDAIKMYVVDLGRSFNSSYVVSDKSQVNTSSISTLKVMNPTLVKVKDGKAVLTISGYEELTKHEDTLLK